MFGLFSFSFDFFPTLMSVQEETRQGPLGLVHSYFLYFVCITCYDKVLFLVSVCLLGDTHTARTVITGPLQPAGCCVTSAPPHNNKEKGSEQEAETYMRQKGHTHVSREAALMLQVSSQNDPLGAGSSGELFIIINGNCGLRCGREKT